VSKHKVEQVSDFFGSMGLRVDPETAHRIVRIASRNGVGGYEQWMSNDGTSFFPASQTQPKLSPGVYEIQQDMSRGLFFERANMSSEGLIRLPDTNCDAVIDEVRCFWEREDKFTSFGLAYKRGLFLHGPPGSGKTSAIRIVCEDVITRGGIVIKFTEPHLMARGLRILREIQPDIPLVVLLEDLDSLIQRYIESDVINLLDGIDGVTKVVFLATSNYPERLGPRIVNRPSRFDRRFYVGPPNEASRRLFFKYLMTQKGASGEKPEEVAIANLDQWVKDTEGMSIAHLKELFVAVHILGTPYAHAIDLLQRMETLPNSEEYNGDDEECITDSMCEVAVDDSAMKVAL